MSKKSNNLFFFSILGLILLIIAGTIYYFLMIDNKYVHKEIVNQETTIIPITTPNKEIIIERDPFIPPPLIVDELPVEPKKINSIEKKKVPLWNEGTINNEKKEEKKREEIIEAPLQGEKPKWKGLISTNNNQVVIIEYMNKSYVLAVGSKLPGTEYQVAEVKEECVLLISPKNQVWLEKEEAKK